MTNQPFDPWATAQDASEETAKNYSNSDFWGQIRMDVWACALVKGQGKVPFDPAVHKKPTAAINLAIDPVPGIDSNFTPERQMVDFEKDWYQFTKPSAMEALQAAGMGTDIRSLPGKFARITFVETGETYPDKKTGQQKAKTAIKFLKIFPDLTACQMDYNLSDNTPAPAQTAPPWDNTTPPPANGNEAEKKTAFQFLKVIVANAVRGQTDMNVIRNTISMNITSGPGHELVSKYFTVDSEETVQLMMEAMG